MIKKINKIYLKLYRDYRTYVIIGEKYIDPIF